MKLELKSIEYSSKMSEETLCYSAVLYVDGRKACHVANRGTGGCDEQHWLDRTVEAKVTAHFAAMPVEKCDIGGGQTMDMQPDLEGWCHDYVARRQDLKAVKSATRKRVIGIHEGKELHFKAPVPLSDAHRAAIAAKYPGILILNGLDDDALLKAVGLIRTA